MVYQPVNDPHLMRVMRILYRLERQMTLRPDPRYPRDRHVPNGRGVERRPGAALPVRRRPTGQRALPNYGTGAVASKGYYPPARKPRKGKRLSRVIGAGGTHPQGFDQ